MRKATPAHGSAKSKLPGVTWIKLDAIKMHNQVRQSMDKQALQELADDIQAHGLLQPIIVRPHHGQYAVIAGHRRRVACEMAGLDQVPAIVGDADEDQVLEMHMAENLQREDLNLDEIARIVTKLYAKYESLDTVALVLNKSKPWVAKHIKFAEKLNLTARQLFEEGISEDLELLNMLSDLAWISFEAGDRAAKLIREGKAGRREIRDALDSAKAARQAMLERQQQTAKRSAPKKARNADQLAAELMYATKEPSSIMEKWSAQELTTFHGAMNAAYRQGQQIKLDPAALVKASHSQRRSAYELAMWFGHLNRNRDEPIDDKTYQALLDDSWKEQDAR